MKEFAKVALIAVALVGGTFAGKVYNQLVLTNLSTETSLVDTKLAPVPLHAYSTRVIVRFGNFTDLGTGNLIRSDLIITNWHNLRNLTKNAALLVELADGSKVQASVLKKDQERDLALIELSKPTILPNLCLAPTEPVKGEILTVAGFGKGNVYEETTGSVVGRRSPTQNGDNTLFLLDCCVKPGMSGSAALNSDRQLAGVIFGCREGYTYGAGVDAIKDFLADTKYWTNK